MSLARIFSRGIPILFLATLLLWSVPETAASEPNLTPEIRNKIDGSLLHLIEMNAASGKIGTSSRAKAFGFQESNGRLLVTARIRDGRDRLSDAELLAVDGVMRARSRSQFDIWVPVDRLAELAATEEVVFLQAPLRPIALATSQAVSISGASVFHSAGNDGSGAKVAIIDLGFTNYTSSVSAGELPNVVWTHDFSGSGFESTNQHGTGVAETVADMAPGAELYLMKIATGTDLENAKDSCIALGINVVNHSVGWFGLPMDGTGSIAGYAEDAYSNGILWVNSAGNHAKKHAGGTYSDSNVDSYHDWSGTDRYIPLTASNGQAIQLMLTWDSWPATNQNYDLYLYNSAKVQIASSTTVQSGGQQPSEYLVHTAPSTGTYYVSIEKVSASSDHDFHLFSIDHDFTNYYDVGSSILTPSDAVNVLSVGAMYWGNAGSSIIESFSSHGPTDDGRMKPEITGFDGTQNYTYGSFYGTSSAAPHVAGGAALLFAGNPGWTVDSVWTSLTSSAIDLGPAGQDSVFGFGQLWIDTASSGGGVIGPVESFAAAAGNGIVDLSWTNPSDTGFQSTLIRYSTSGYPVSEGDGTGVENGGGGVFANSPGSSDAYQHTGRTNGTTYYYSAFAYDGTDYSAKATGEATPEDTAAGPPSPVLSFAATAGNESVDLSWNNPSDTAFQLTLIRYSTFGYPADETDGNPVENSLAGMFVNTPGSSDSYEHTSLTNGTTYYYTAFAYDGAGYSSGVTDLATPQDTTPPLPQPVAAFTATPGDTTVTLRWTNPNEPDFASTTIRYSVSGFPSNPAGGLAVENGNGGVFSNTPASADSFAHTGLTNDVLHYYTAFATDDTSYSTGEQAFARPADTDPPTQVTGFLAVAGEGEVLLSWTNPPDADFKHTHIRFSTTTYPANTGAGNFLSNITGSPGSPDSYDHTGRTDGVTYYYSAFSVDQVNNESAPAEASATPADTTGPAPVTQVVATAGDGEVELSWKNPGDSDFEFTRVRYSSSGYPTGPDDALSAGEFSGAPNSSVTINHSGLSNGTTYYYSLFAFDDWNNSSSAAQASAVPTDSIAPVSSFVAVPGDGRILLRWTNPAVDVFTGTRIMVSTSAFPSDPGEGTSIGDYAGAPGSLDSISHAGLTNGTIYYYAAFAYDDSGSYAAAMNAAATPEDTTAPSPVASFAATSGDEEVLLSWTNPPDGDFARTIVMYSTAGYPADTLSGTALGSFEGAPGADTSYMHSGLSNGLTYYYSAFALDHSANVSVAGEASAVPVDTIPPGPATALQVTGGDGQVSLHWTNPGDADFQYVSIRFDTSSAPDSPTGGDFVGTFPGDPSGSDSATHTGLTNGTTYYYSLFAFDEAGNTSTVLNGTATPGDETPPGPINAFQTVKGDGEVLLGWTNPSDSDFVRAEVRWSTLSPPANEASGNLLGIYFGAPDGSHETVHGGLTNGTTYFYSAFAHDGDGNMSSAVSDSATPTDTIAPGPPMSALAVGQIQAVSLSWVVPPDPDGAGVAIRWATNGAPLDPSEGEPAPNGTEGLFAGAPSQVDSFTHSGLQGDTTYYYSLFTYDESGNYSNPVFVSGVPESPAPVVDVTPPSAPALFEAEPHDGRVRLHWVNASDDDLAGIEFRYSRSGYPSGPADGFAVGGASRTTIAGVPGTADSLDHVDLMNDSLYYYIAFSYDTAANYSVAAFDTARPADKTAPALYLGVFQNPYFTQSLDLFLGGSEVLDSSSVGLTVGGEPLLMTLLDMSENLWSGTYELPGGGIYAIEGEADDRSGNGTVTSSAIAAGVVGAGDLALTSPDGRFHLSVTGIRDRAGEMVLIFPAETDGIRKIAGTGSLKSSDSKSNAFTIMSGRQAPETEALIRWSYLDSELENVPPEAIVIRRRSGESLETSIDQVNREAFVRITEFGTFVLSAEPGASSMVVPPRVVRLGANAPNPFNPVTVIPFETGSAGPVSLKILALSGREIRTLIDQPLDGGIHSIRWDGTDSGGRHVGSGFYLYRLDTMGGSETRKMLLLR